MQQQILWRRRSDTFVIVHRGTAALINSLRIDVLISATDIDIKDAPLKLSSDTAIPCF